MFDKQGKRSIWLHDLFPQEGPQPDRNAMLQSAIEEMLASTWPGQSPNSPGMQTSVASPSTPHGSPASAHFVLPSDHSAPGLEEQTVQAHGPQPRPMTIGESHLQAQAHAQHNEPSMLPQPQPPDNPDATIHRHPDGRIFLHSESRMSTRWLHRTSSNGADDYEVFKMPVGLSMWHRGLQWSLLCLSRIYLLLRLPRQMLQLPLLHRKVHHQDMRQQQRVRRHPDLTQQRKHRSNHTQPEKMNVRHPRNRAMRPL